ncbi:RraA family protein [Paenibacillus sp. FSL R10-2782]|uniref:RraA family protein n=1 Tax=Paenibacillus sp. FSL R10-2782 TaxID=2954661 RepID=UPI0031598BF0
MFRIQPRVQGITTELLELYQHVSASTLGHFTDFGCMQGVQPLFRPIRLLGNAVTVRLPHMDSTAVRHALELAQAGDVLVVDMSGDDARACWGEFRAYVAMKKQLAGVIVSGCVTDVGVLNQLQFPIFSKGISALTTRTLELEGEVNTPISLFGVSVHPGDLILGDDDGVFVVKPGEAWELGEKALEKQRKEELTRKQFGYDQLLNARLER